MKKLLLTTLALMLTVPAFAIGEKIYVNRIVKGAKFRATVDCYMGSFWGSPVPRPTFKVHQFESYFEKSSERNAEQDFSSDHFSLEVWNDRLPEGLNDCSAYKSLTDKNFIDFKVDRAQRVVRMITFYYKETKVCRRLLMATDQIEVELFPESWATLKSTSSIDAGFKENVASEEECDNML